MFVYILCSLVVPAVKKYSNCLVGNYCNLVYLKDDFYQKKNTIVELVSLFC